MTTDELERRLFGLFAYPMSADQVAAVHARLAAASTPTAPRVPFRRSRSRLVRGLVLAALLTLLVVAAAVASLELLERVVSEAEPGSRTAFDDAVALDITVQTPAGDLTIDRGYADANRVMLALVMPSADVHGFLRLTDGAGREWRTFASASVSEESGTTAFVETWIAPEPIAPGDLAFTLVSQDPEHPDEPDASSVEFVLPVVAGSTVTPEQSVEREEITMTLHSFTVTATSVHAQVTAGPLDADRSWAAASLTYELDGANPLAEAGGFEIELEDVAGVGRRLLGVDAGVEDAAGEWTFRIGELVGADAEGEQVRIAGPWEFSFTLP